MLENSEAAAAGAAPDPFDPNRLRLPQDFATSVGVKKIFSTCPVKKPSREWFVRCHPDPKYSLQTGVIELKEDREVYLVAPELRDVVSTEATFGARRLVTSINRQGTLFIWPIRLPGADGRLDDWSASALDAAHRAEARWVRSTANMSLGAYDIFEAPESVAEPVWPDVPFRKILEVAFKGKVIDCIDHPVLRRLRGEA